MHITSCQCQSRTAVVFDFLAALNWTVRFGVWVVVSSALKARHDDWWRTKLDGKVVVVVVGWWLVVHACRFIYVIYMRARYDMLACGQIFDRTPPADLSPCCLACSVSFLVVVGCLVVFWSLVVRCFAFPRIFLFLFFSVPYVCP